VAFAPTARLRRTLAPDASCRNPLCRQERVVNRGPMPGGEEPDTADYGYSLLTLRPSALALTWADR